VDLLSSIEVMIFCGLRFHQYLSALSSDQPNRPNAANKSFTRQVIESPEETFEHDLICKQCQNGERSDKD
jgi:hypothetical protein